jgi:hypothetical protein
MDDEFSALMKNKTWHHVPPHEEAISLTANRFTNQEKSR